MTFISGTKETMVNFTHRTERSVLMLWIVLPGVLALAALLWPTGRAVAAANSCATSSPTSGAYTVTLCIVQPAQGGPVTGLAPVEATVTVSGTNPGTSKLIFRLGGEYLLTDYEIPYTFMLPSHAFANGVYTLSVAATMRDLYESAPAEMAISIVNAAEPPPGPDFVPHTVPAPPAGQSVTIAVHGDGAGGETAAAQVAQLVESWNPALVLYAGDVYEQGSYTEMLNWYGFPGPSGTFFGRLYDITNPVVGNHEYLTPNAAGYYKYWNNIPAYYSYDAAGWHFIALNSTAEFGETAPNKPQFDWLLAEVAENTNPCTIAYFHHPVLSVGPQEGDIASLNEIWQVLVEDGVDMAFVGHDHSYQRWEPLDAGLNPDPLGITQFVVGNGGHGVQNFITSDPRLVVGFDDPTTSVGALKLTLNPKGAEFAMINTAGEVLDQGVVPCTGAAPDSAPPRAPQTVEVEALPTGSALVRWSAAFDDTGVAAYDLYRNGAKIATLGGAILAYEDKNAPFNATYVYSVEAIDVDGKRSARRNSPPFVRPAQATLTLTPVADTYVDDSRPETNFGKTVALRVRPSAPAQSSYLRFDVRSTDGAITAATLRLYTVNGTGAAAYNVHAVGANTWDEITTTFANRPALGAVLANSGGLAPGEWRTFDVDAHVQGDGPTSFGLSAAGTSAANLSSREGEQPPQLIIQVNAPPPPPPAAPANLQANAPAAGRVELTWSAAASANGVQEYIIRRNGADLASVGGDRLDYTDTAVQPGTTYTYAVVAVNYSGAQSPASGSASATTPATPPVELEDIVLSAVADAYVSSVQPEANFGTSAVLRADAAPEHAGYLRFDVPALGGVVTKATLHLYARSGSTAGYQVQRLNDDGWDEATIRYSIRPATGKATRASNTNFAAGTWTAVDVTEWVQANHPLSLALIGLHPVGIAFLSRENGEGLAPQLVIEQIASAAGAPAAAESFAAQADTPAAEPDADGDGVPDAVEALNGTKPDAADSDEDGLPDLWEIETGLVSEAQKGSAADDPDGDGVSNSDELSGGSDPFDATSMPAAPSPGDEKLYLPLVGK